LSDVNVVEIKNIVKIYETGSVTFKALKGVDLKITKGEFTSIMGASGSGKSTLMNILGCLDKMSEGEYYLNGKNISMLKDDELAFIRNKEIGFVFQAFNLLPRMTVLENVELPMIYAGVSNTILIPYIAGLASHYFLDSFTKYGLPLYLFKGKRFRMPLSYSSGDTLSEYFILSIYSVGIGLIGLQYMNGLLASNITKGITFITGYLF